MSDLVPQSESDLFISYAHSDNLPIIENARGWVDNLHRALEIRVTQLLGEMPRIWRDTHVDRGGYDEVSLSTRAALHDSAALLCVLSPGYLRSERCLWELEEYLSHHSKTDSAPLIFKVLASPIRLDQQPPELAERLGYEFFKSDPVTGRTRLFDEIFGVDAQRDFWMRLDDLAHDIAGALKGFRENIVPKSISLTKAKTGPFDIVESNGKRRPLRVFLCHASQDKGRVKDLYQLLVDAGIDAWLDEEKLIPGQLWENEIQRALRSSDAVLVCLSSSSITKTGYIQKEIRQVLDVADEYPDETIFLIPARFENCVVPERFSKRQWVDLFDDRGEKNLMRALELRTSQLIAETL